MSAIKTAVAGAARSLWMEHIGPSISLEHLLYSEPGARIVWKQARLALGSPISLQEFVMFTMSRWALADAAQSLATNCGIEQEWLATATPGKIIGAYEGSLLRLELANRALVADAAQWLHLNRDRVTEAWLHSKDGETIRRVRSIAQSYSERLPLQVKKYSLSDLRKAYDMGFGASGEGWNGEIYREYLENENYLNDRVEALKEFN